MEYHFINENNEQIGPLTIEELKAENIKKTSKVWKQGMTDWVNAETVKDFDSLLVTPPPIPSNTPPPIKNTPPIIERQEVKLNVNKIKTHQKSSVKQGIEITTKHAITAWMYKLTKTIIVIDGVEKKMKWGKYFYEISEGEHTLNIYIPYMGMKINKKNVVKFTIKHDEIRKLKFNAPHIVTAKGKYNFLN